MIRVVRMDFGSIHDAREISNAVRMAGLDAATRLDKRERVLRTYGDSLTELDREFVGILASLGGAGDGVYNNVLANVDHDELSGDAQDFLRLLEQAAKSHWPERFIGQVIDFYSGKPAGNYKGRLN